MPVFTFTRKPDPDSDGEAIVKLNPRTLLVWAGEETDKRLPRLAAVMHIHYDTELFVRTARRFYFFTDREPLNALYEVDDDSFADFNLNDWPASALPVIDSANPPATFTLDTADLLDERDQIKAEALALRNLDHEMEHNFGIAVSALSNIHSYLVAENPEHAPRLASTDRNISILKEHNVYFGLSTHLTDALINLCGPGHHDVGATSVAALKLSNTLMARYYDRVITHDSYTLTLKSGQTRDTASRFVQDVEAIPVVPKRTVTEAVVDEEVAKIVAARGAS